MWEVAKGGGIRAVLQKHSHIIGGIFELPEVAVEEMKALNSQFEGRFSVFSGSFFESLPFKADGLILKRVLHDWDDEHCTRILSKCRDALENSSSEIFVVESLLKGKEDPALLRIFDLLLLTVFGGFERTLEEYELLFSKAGLKIKNTISTDSGMSILVLHAIP